MAGILSKYVLPRACCPTAPVPDLRRVYITARAWCCFHLSEEQISRVVQDLPHSSNELAGVYPGVATGFSNMTTALVSRMVEIATLRNCELTWALVFATFAEAHKRS